MKKIKPAGLHWLVAVAAFGLAAVATQELAKRAHGRRATDRYQQAGHPVTSSTYRYTASF